MATFTGTSNVVDIYPKKLGDGDINYGAQSVTCALTVGATAPNNSLEFASQLVGEVSDADYARETLTSVTWTQVANKAKLSSNPVTFASSTADITAKWYVLIYNTGNNATSPIIQWGLLDNTDNPVTVSPPDSIVITPDGTNGWNDVTVV